jgi:hypothetical protein
VQQDRADGDQGDLPVISQDDVDPVWRRDPLEAGDEQELQSDLGQPDEAEGDGELEPERAPRRHRRHQHEEYRHQYDRQVEQQPEESANSPVHAPASLEMNETGTPCKRRSSGG